MIYTIHLEHSSPLITARTVTRQRWDMALLAAKHMAYSSLGGLALRDRPVAHRVMADLDRGSAATGTLTVSFADYTLTISQTKTYTRKSRAKGAHDETSNTHDDR